MPIKDKSLYPADWPEISEQVRQAAGQMCQQCGVRNHARGYRLPDGAFVELEASNCAAARAMGKKVITIVLTVAHLDHTPANCDWSNLRAYCQRCHNIYDAPLRAKHAAETRRRRQAGQMELTEVRALPTASERSPRSREYRAARMQLSLGI